MIEIDCDVDPFLPEGWEIESHLKGGQLLWTPANILLYLSDKQKVKGIISGEELLEELRRKQKKVMNACVLDFLLEHPEKRPDEWRGKFVHFWSTIYRDPLGNRAVRFLYDKSDGQLGWNSFLHRNVFDNPNYPAACYK